MHDHDVSHVVAPAAASPELVLLIGWAIILIVSCFMIARRRPAPPKRHPVLVLPPLGARYLYLHPSGVEIWIHPAARGDELVDLRQRGEA